MSEAQYSYEQVMAARAKLWQMGDLVWKLDPTQVEIYNFLNNRQEKTLVVNCSRRLGKSYMLLIIAIEICIRKPRAVIKYLQPEVKMIEINIMPVMEEILADCPQELRPTYHIKKNMYIFPNGSQIQLAGTDNNGHEKLRGGNANLCIIDEAGFVTNKLDYIIRSVLIPTTTLTKGKILLSSTSPTEPDHPFAKYMEDAEIKGTLIKKTIYDALNDHKKLKNPRITESMIQEIIDSYPGGARHEGFRREYLCETVRDGDNSVIPEFTDEVEKDIVVEWPRPAFCTKYVAMDIGHKDLTVALFAYYDFENAIIVVEDEIVMSGPKMTTDSLAQAIKKKEQDLWTDKLTLEFSEPYLRVSDNNLILINDLQRLHGLTFIPTQKDNKDAAINLVRMTIANHEMYINPRCKTLIAHLRRATWNKDRTKFTRSADNGHFDALDALVYLVRNINKSKNPFPKGYKFRSLTDRDAVFYTDSFKDNTEHSQFKKLFKPRKT